VKRLPIAPLNKKCRELGCQNNKTSRSTFCVQHGGGITEKGRENSKLYSQSYWKKQRQAQLSKSPLCVSCLSNGKVIQAEHIDHVFPHRQNPDRFRRNIFQSLCPACHTLKTQMETRGTYLHFTNTGVISYNDADYERVMKGR
jgi:hypothetical protein